MTDNTAWWPTDYLWSLFYVGRIPLPVCVLLGTIQEMYPSHDGHYVGYNDVDDLRGDVKGP